MVKQQQEGLHVHVAPLMNLTDLKCDDLRLDGKHKFDELLLAQ